VGCTIQDFVELAGQLDGLQRVDRDRYTSFEVQHNTFAYLWEPTRTVGLCQTRVEQMALVLERPQVFEVQFTTGRFGWVVVKLDLVERDELAELVFEAWRLRAPEALVVAAGEQLPE
jgi:hypothetical protein